MNHTLPTLFRCCVYSSVACVPADMQPGDGLLFRNHEKTSTCTEQESKWEKKLEVVYLEMNGCHIVIQAEPHYMISKQLKKLLTAAQVKSLKFHCVEMQQCVIMTAVILRFSFKNNCSAYDIIIQKKV